MMMNGAGLDVLMTAASPVIQSGVLALAGGLLCFFGKIKHPEGTSVIAAACFYLYIPALTFSKLASTVTLDRLYHLWPLLVNMTWSVVFGIFSGLCAAWVMRVENRNRNIVIAALAFKNVGNLPLVFVGSLCQGETIFVASLGDGCYATGVGYVALDICAATILQFTIAIHLLKKAPAIVSSRDVFESGISRVDCE